MTQTSRTRQSRWARRPSTTDRTVGRSRANWADATYAATADPHTDNITTHTGEVDGGTAPGTRCVIVEPPGKDTPTVQLMRIRRIDRLWKRDGLWRIVVCRPTVKHGATAQASMLWSPFFM